MEKYHFFTDHTCSIDTFEVLTQELTRVNLDFNPLEFCLTITRMLEKSDEEIEAFTHYLDAQLPSK